MTLVAASPASSIRRARTLRVAMCPPTFFEVAYSINPWMAPQRPVDRDRAMTQWRALRDAYRALGHQVDEIEPVDGLPDLVFSANAGLVVDGKVMLSRFRHPERQAEEAVFRDWFRSQGYEPVDPSEWNEGEGDHLVVGDTILAGRGFRSDDEAHREVARHFGRPVLSLTLVDPRFYHLDTALAVLDDETIAYWPGAFDEASRAALEDRFPDAVIATEDNAIAFGLNACSDGRHVVLAAGAVGLAAQLAARGFEPIPLDTSELQKSGGSVKCCTLELRP